MWKREKELLAGQGTLVDWKRSERWYSYGNWLMKVAVEKDLRLIGRLTLTRGETAEGTIVWRRHGSDGRDFSEWVMCDVPRSAQDGTNKCILTLLETVLVEWQGSVRRSALQYSSSEWTREVGDGRGSDEVDRVLNTAEIVKAVARATENEGDLLGR